MTGSGRIAWLSTLLAALSFPLHAIDLAYDQVSDRGSVVDIRHAGDGSGRLFLLEQGGRVWILQGDETLDEPFLDMSDRLTVGGERGLLSLAFEPAYASTGRFYTWSTNPEGNMDLSRWTVSNDPDRADLASQEVILTVDQPRTNHNGGRLQFGPDGYLYLGIGDGGGAGDPDDEGQSLQSLLGTVIRIDVVNRDSGYAVPPDNPYVNENGLNSIWAHGLRNPWRMSFDRLTGTLFIADVGQNRYEEINAQPFLAGGGQNYGWNRKEGPFCFSEQICSNAGLTEPIGGYQHSQGCSVTGGEVYRGEAYGDLHGRYLFGDFCTGRIWSLHQEGEEWVQELLDESGFGLLTFGEGEDGSLYLSGSGSGVYRLRDGTTQAERPFGFNAGLNDVWYNPATAGQGFFITVLPASEQVFMAWFSFEAEAVSGGTAQLGAPEQRWLTALGPINGGQARLTASLTRGGVFEAASPAPETATVGELLLSFTSCQRGMVTYQFPDLGLEGQVPIARVAPDNIALCEALASGE